MTTTLTKPTPSTDSAATSSPTGGSRPPRRNATSSKIGVVLAAIIVVALGAGLWWIVDVARAANLTPETDRYTVLRRGFTVSLREKGELKAANSTQLKCEVEGRSTVIRLIPEGAQVQEGDLLVELASDQIDDRIRQQELQLANAELAYESAQTELEIQRDRNESDIRKGLLEIELKKLTLEKYEKGDWEQAHKDALIEIERAEINLERRQEDYEVARKLLDNEYITQAEYDEDEFNLKKAEWDLEKAKRSLDILIEYTDKTERRQKESDVQEAEKELERIKKNAEAEEQKRIGAVEAKRKELELIRAELAKLQAQKRNCSIYAPAPGFVVYGAGGGGGRHWRDDDEIREGASVHERQVLVTLPDTSTMVVVARVHEAKTDRIQLGQAARVYVEGIPDKHFTGTITKIASVADSSNRWLNPDLKEYETEITLAGSDPLLKPGATAHAEIFVGQVNDVLAVPVQAVFSRGPQRFLFKADGERIEPVEVQLGATSNEWAEVSGPGIAERDQILLAFGEQEKRLLPEAAAVRSEAWAGMKLPEIAEETDMPTVEKFNPEGQPNPGGERRAAPASRDRRGDRRRGAGKSAQSDAGTPQTGASSRPSTP